MKHIPTTATAVEKLKKDAKALADAEGVALHLSQHRVAQAAGYLHWHHVTMCAEQTKQDVAQQARITALFAQLVAGCEREFGFNSDTIYERQRYMESRGNGIHLFRDSGTHAGLFLNERTGAVWLGQFWDDPGQREDYTAPTLPEASHGA